jgi:HK97 family phage major capsid protein
VSVFLNREARRLLARRGRKPADLGRVYNRMAPPGNRQSWQRADSNAGTGDGDGGQQGNGPGRGAPSNRSTAPALPRTTSDWEQYLNSLDSPEKFAEEYKNTGEDGFRAKLTSYITAVNNERLDLLEQVREQTETQLTEWLQANQKDMIKSTNRLDLNVAEQAGARPSPVLNNPRAVGAPLNGVWPDFYAFLQDIYGAKTGRVTNEAAERWKAYNTYSEKVPSEGGFLVPEEFRSTILRLAMENAVVRPRATVIPMGSPRLNIPCIDETSRVSSVFGGVVVYRTEEGAELTESSATFASVKLDVTKQTALSHVPNELIRDWGAFGAFMDSTLPAAMAFSEDVDYISGNGVGGPLGGLNAANTALIAVSGETSQTASTIVWENVIKMYARMLPSSLGSAVWIASPDTFAELATMALVVGTGGSAVWLTDGRGAPVLTLLGRPVIMSEKAPAALGTQGDLSFVDWGMYLIGDYQMMTIDSSPHVKFTSDKTTFRAIARNDGQPWLKSPLTPHNNSATLSPFVTLATR